MARDGRGSSGGVDVEAVRECRVPLCQVDVPRLVEPELVPFDTDRRVGAAAE